MNPAAVILAGGRGERLGGTDKAELQIGGIRLIERVAARLATCSPRLIASGPPMRREHHLDGWTSVSDLPGDYGGPLAGAAAAVAHLHAIGSDADLLVVAAVDAPFLPEHYVDWLVAGLGSAAAAIASYAGQSYPTNSIWRLDAVRDLPANVLAGVAAHSLKRLSERLGGKDLEWPETAEGDPFANANTPAELAALQLRAKASND